MNALDVYSEIAQRLNAGQYSGLVDPRLIETAVKKATVELINEVWIKEDTKDVTRRGISKDERLANMLASSLRASVTYKPINILTGNRENGAPIRANFDSLNDETTKNYAVGVTTPTDFLFPYTFNIVTTKGFIKYLKPTESGANIPKSYGNGNWSIEVTAGQINDSNENMLAVDKVRYVADVEVIDYERYKTIVHNRLMNAYKSKIYLIPVSSYVIPNTGDNFVAHYYVPSNGEPPVGVFDGSAPLLYWVVTAPEQEVLELKLIYIRKPSDFHIDLEHPENCIDLDLPQPASDIVIDKAVAFILTGKFPEGDQYQTTLNRIAANDIRQQP